MAAPSSTSTESKGKEERTCKQTGRHGAKRDHSLTVNSSFFSFPHGIKLAWHGLSFGREVDFELNFVLSY